MSLDRPRPMKYEIVEPEREPAPVENKMFEKDNQGIRHNIPNIPKIKINAKLVEVELTPFSNKNTAIVNDALKNIKDHDN